MFAHPVLPSKPDVIVDLCNAQSGVPAACEGHESSAALQRLQSSPAAMMSAASGGLSSTMRPMTSYAIGSHSQEAAGPGELRADDLPPCVNPSQAMNDARRLVKHHPEQVAPHMHTLLWDIAPMTDDLRSFLSKMALTFLLVSVQLHASQFAQSVLQLR